MLDEVLIPNNATAEAGEVAGAEATGGEVAGATAEPGPFEPEDE